MFRVDDVSLHHLVLSFDFQKKQEEEEQVSPPVYFDEYSLS